MNRVNANYREVWLGGGQKHFSKVNSTTFDSRILLLMRVMFTWHSFCSQLARDRFMLSNFIRWTRIIYHLQLTSHFHSEYIFFYKIDLTKHQTLSCICIFIYIYKFVSYIYIYIFKWEYIQEEAHREDKIPNVLAHLLYRRDEYRVILRIGGDEGVCAPRSWSLKIPIVG